MGQYIEFPDVSFYQGEINWDVMHSKVNNVIIRSSQGNWEDSQFKTNYSSAKARGIKRGIYHFFDDRYSPQQQIDVIKNLITNDLPETRVWVDWESLSYHDGGSYKGLANVVSVMKGIESAFPSTTVGIYTGYYWFVDHSNQSSNAKEYEYLKTKPLWIAAYTAGGSSSGLLIPYPWTYPPELHQWGTPPIGYDYGVETIEIDMNRVLKNQSVYAGDTPVPPDPPAQGGTMIGKVITSSLNIRRQPNSDNTTNAPIGSLKLNDIIEADFETNGWWHLKKITRTGVAVVLPAADCYSYEGTNNGYIQDITPSTEPVPPQEVYVKDGNGVLWKSTTFTRA